MNMAGDPALQSVILDELKKSFKPEFLNRLDDVVTFNPLGESEIEKIVTLFFADIAKKVQDRDITLVLEASATAHIAKAGFDPVYGARPLKRALYEIVEDRLADLILSGEVDEGATVTFSAQAEEINVSVS
jgi:ATP-dependent Clp protease ATP-binding subunit ClpB